jgi:DUF4097 and DUF4098 domain-containing protein YvlB
LTLDLRLPSGEIEVESGAGEETILELDASRDNDDMRAVLDGTRIELRQRGDGHEVLVDVERKRFGFLLDMVRGGLTLRVHVPDHADVQISTSSADVDLRGRFGSLKAQLASGDLRADDLDGRVDVKSASGDVELQRVGGSASVVTASGDIAVRVVHGEATLRSASGDVKTMSGDASSELDVRDRPAEGDGPQVEIRATSMSGDIRIHRA